MENQVTSSATVRCGPKLKLQKQEEQSLVSNQVKPPNQDAMVISQALTAKSGSEWLVDSGATSHMSNNRREVDPGGEEERVSAQPPARRSN